MKDKTPLMLLVEEKAGKEIREFLVDLYVKKDMTIPEIVRYLDNKLGIVVSTAGVWKWLVKLGIPRRQWSLISNK